MSRIQDAKFDADVREDARHSTVYDFPDDVVEHEPEDLEDIREMFGEGLFDEADYKEGELPEEGGLVLVDDDEGLEPSLKSEDLEKDFRWRGMTPWGELLVSKNCDIYRGIQGMVPGWIPFQKEADDPSGDPGVHFGEPDLDMVPPMGQVARLFDIFHSRYRKEVVVTVWKHKRKKRWMYLVPEQEGSAGGVGWNDPKCDQQGMAYGTYVGSIHSHPGNGTTPSQTDEKCWSQPGHWGIHIIVGRDQSYTMASALGSEISILDEGSFKEERRETKVRYQTRDGVPLSQLLKDTPPPAVKRKTRASDNRIVRINGGATYKLSPQTVELVMRVPTLRVDISQDLDLATGLEISVIQTDQGEFFLANTERFLLAKAPGTEISRFRIPSAGFFPSVGG